MKARNIYALQKELKDTKEADTVNCWTSLTTRHEKINIESIYDDYITCQMLIFSKILDSYTLT